MGVAHRTADAHVGVQRGDGLVARLGSAVTVIGTTDAQTDPFASALLSALDDRRAEPGKPAASFAWEVADLVAAHRRQAPAFGLAIGLDDGYQILLHGAVRAVVSCDGSEIELTGRSAGTWVDRIVIGPVRRISITLADGAVDVDPRSDLRAGLVGGGGLILVPTGSVPTGPQATVDRPFPPPVPQQPALATTPAPAPAPAPAPNPAPQTPTIAPAVARAFGIVEETAIVKTTTSALVADDGTRIPLDRHYVFGRDPSHEPSVVRGAASPIVVRDPDQVVSRVQVHVSVVGDVVTLRDGGSSNGTYIAAPGAAEWDRLTDRPTPLPRGWSMRIGRRVYTYTVGQS